MITKEKILEEIRRYAEKNGGRPLGVDRFTKETGIKPYDWGKFWARFGDAQKEAGFVPNQLQESYSDEFLIKKLINIVRKLGKFPTSREIAIEKNSDAQLPDKKVFQRLGTKEQLARKVTQYCETKKDFDDVLGFCKPILEKSVTSEDTDELESNENLGEVYLFKSGRYYKIGKTNNTVRRGHELRIQLPEEIDLIHSIKTDDPNGVELYWHKRFDSRRMNGEWFDLKASDIKAFKRWRRIY